MGGGGGGGKGKEEEEVDDDDEEEDEACLQATSMGRGAAVCTWLARGEAGAAGPCGAQA